MFSILRRAQALQPLQAWERAFVKLVGSIKPAVLGAAFTAISSGIIVEHTYSPYVLACAAISAALAAAYMSFEKLLSASTDPAAQKVGEAMQDEQGAVLSALGQPNDMKQPAA